MLKNWSLITTTANTEQIVIRATEAEKPDLVSAFIFNGNVSDSNIYLTLNGSNGNVKAILINSSWKAQETVFLEQFKLFMNVGDTLRVTTSTTDVSLLFNGKV